MKQASAIAATAILGIGLASCSETADEEEVTALTKSASLEAKEAVAKLSGPSSDAEGEAKQAEIRAFVDSIYDTYARDGMGVDINRPELLFEPELASAIAKVQDAAAAMQEVPDGLGADPFCECQDFGEFSHNIEFVTVTGNQGTAKVIMSNFGEQTTRMVQVENTPDGWRVYDLDNAFREQFL